MRKVIRVKSTTNKPAITISGWDKNISVKKYLLLFQEMFSNENQDFLPLFDTLEKAKEYGCTQEDVLGYGCGWNVLQHKNEISFFYAACGDELNVVLDANGGVLVVYGHNGLSARLKRSFDCIDKSVCQSIVADFETFERLQREYSIAPSNQAAHGCSEEKRWPDAHYALPWGNQIFFCRHYEAQ